MLRWLFVRNNTHLNMIDCVNSSLVFEFYSYLHHLTRINVLVLRHIVSIVHVHVNRLIVKLTLHSGIGWCEKLHAINNKNFPKVNEHC